MNLIIKAATADDAEALAEFNSLMAMETENLKLDPETVKNGVKRLLQRPEQGHYYIAWVDGERAGSAMITHEWSDWRDGQMWWIQSVFIEKVHRRKGVFRALYKHMAAQAKQSPDTCGLRLYVEQHNHGAQATYKAMGMQETHYRLYEQMFE